MAEFVHLEKEDHRHPANYLAWQDDVDVTVTKVERSRQYFGLDAELPEQDVGRLAPMGLAPNLSDPGCRIRRAGKQQDRKQDLPKEAIDANRTEETRRWLWRLRVRGHQVALSSILLALALSALGRTRFRTPSFSIASMRSRSMFSESVNTLS